MFYFILLHDVSIDLLEFIKSFHQKSFSTDTPACHVVLNMQNKQVSQNEAYIFFSMILKLLMVFSSPEPEVQLQKFGLYI